MLSVTIIAKDAASSLARCIKSVRSLASEIIVVVDSNTQDETADIARSLGAKVFTRKFDNFSSQKNFAVSKAKYEWILAMDVDEYISPQLSEEIKGVLSQAKYAAFIIPRQNYIFSKVIHYTDWGPNTDAHVWLWKKSRGKWVGDVHEEVVVQGLVGRLKGCKIHTNYNSVEQFIDKMNLYTSYEARNKRFTWWNLMVHPVWKFVRHYAVFIGFLDGWHGLFLSYLMAIYGLSIYVKAWEKKNLS